MGIVGMPNVGKSTLFKALTDKEVLIANYPFATIDPNIGVVPVPDERLAKLAELSKSKRIVPAIIEFVDIAGLVKGASQGEGLGNAFLTHIRDTDAILQVVRVFQNPDILHVNKEPDPESDFLTISLELILKDLDTVSKALTKAESEAKTGDTKKLARRDAIKRIKDLLEADSLLYSAGMNEEDKLLAEELQLLTIKPMLVVFNISDKELAADWKPDAKLSAALKGVPYLSIPIGIEGEAAGMPGVEAGEFRELAGIKESGLQHLIRKSYEVLGLITFLTTGEDETRAWTIPAGSTAPRAGRAIHSDFEEKFIRAEVIFWSDLLEAGSRAKAREKGLMRTEGKTYVVKDGDVIEFLIN